MFPFIGKLWYMSLKLFYLLLSLSIVANSYASLPIAIPIAPANLNPQSLPIIKTGSPIQGSQYLLANPNLVTNRSNPNNHRPLKITTDEDLTDCSDSESTSPKYAKNKSICLAALSPSYQKPKMTFYLAELPDDNIQTTGHHITARLALTLDSQDLQSDDCADKTPCTQLPKTPAPSVPQSPIFRRSRSCSAEERDLSAQYAMTIARQATTGPDNVE